MIKRESTSDSALTEVFFVKNKTDTLNLLAVLKSDTYLDVANFKKWLDNRVFSTKDFGNSKFTTTRLYSKGLTMFSSLEFYHLFGDQSIILADCSQVKSIKIHLSIPDELLKKDYDYFWSDFYLKPIPVNFISKH